MEFAVIAVAAIGASYAVTAFVASRLLASVPARIDTFKPPPLRTMETYWTALHFTRAQPLRCDHLADTPSVGDYFRSRYSVPTPTPSQGVGCIARSADQGATRYGSMTASGQLLVREPASRATQPRATRSR